MIYCIGNRCRRVAVLNRKVSIDTFFKPLLSHEIVFSTVVTSITLLLLQVAMRGSDINSMKH
jgi:hypothetical protein